MLYAHSLMPSKDYLYSIKALLWLKRRKEKNRKSLELDTSDVDDDETCVVAAMDRSHALRRKKQ